MNAVEHYQQVVRLYQEARRPWPATAIEIADWGLRAGHLKPKPADLVKQFASELSRAMREEYITDPQGREVRAKHARRTTIGGEQKTCGMTSGPHREITCARPSSSDGSRSSATADS